MDERMISDWVWVPNWTAEDDSDARIVYFRKEFVIDTLEKEYLLDITADSGYKLYVNGAFVQKGPQKGTPENWYVDTVDIGESLLKGKNAIAIEVIRYPEKSELRNDSVYHTPYPGLYILDKNKGGLLCARNGYKSIRAVYRKIVGEPYRPAPIHITEIVAEDSSFRGWKESGYDDKKWEETSCYSFFDANKACIPFNIFPRYIPYMHYERCHFHSVVCVREGIDTSQWEDLILKDKALTLKANSHNIVELSAGEEMCGFPILSFIAGKGASVKMIHSECYVTDKKGDRTDWVKGHLEGAVDQYNVSGWGTEAYMEEYEPFWFKTFRFIRLEIETKDEPLTIQSYTYRATGYPLEIATSVKTSDESLQDVWEISERTLKRCMHETYIDCPYYEQLQYTMDSRAEILFTYMTSADDRLAKECMEAFRSTQSPAGLMKACAPAQMVNIIPGFSIFYILMVHDHMMFFDDKQFIRRQMTSIDAVLEFFDRNISKLGLVSGIGGKLFEAKYWSFIDWTPEWNETIGVPKAAFCGDGSITMESLLYLYGLQHAAEIMNYLNRTGVANEYMNRAGQLKDSIKKYCMEDGIILDGPNIKEYSMHCQVFGVLTGILEGEAGKRALETAMDNKKFAQCSVAMNFYLFRALEKAGWYEKSEDVWNLWRKMLTEQLTTCVENDVDGRSDCHAWGATILYELPAVTLGVRPAAPGFAKVTIKPNPGYLSYASGDVKTPRGMVHVEWNISSDGTMNLNYSVPEGVEAAS